MLNGKKLACKRKSDSRSARKPDVTQSTLRGRKSSKPKRGSILVKKSPFSSFQHEKLANVSMEVLYTENSALKTRVSVLKNQVKKLRSSSKQTDKPPATAQVHRLKATVNDLKTQLRQKTDELFKLKFLYARKGRSRLSEDPTIDLADRNKVIVQMFEKRGLAPAWFTRLNQELANKSVSIGQFIGAHKVHLPSLVKKLEAFHIFVQPHELQELLEILPETIPTEVFAEIFRNCVRDTHIVTEGEVQATFKHMAMRLQLYRIPKNQLLQTLFGTQFEPAQMLAKDELKALLQQPPLKIMHVHELEVFIRYLLGPKSEITAEHLLEVLETGLDSWLIFTNEQEETFDEELCSVLAQHKHKLKSVWVKHDSRQSGMVTCQQFFGAFDKLNVYLKPELRQYLCLLFYSYSYTLNTAPYIHFINTYSQPIDDEEEGERTVLIKKYLEVIARNMLKYSRSTRSTFVDQAGFVYPESFIKGLRDIGMGDLEEDAVVMILEGLQCEGRPGRLCIKAGDLEDILECYGVSRETEKTIETEKSVESVIIRNDSSIDLTTDPDEIH